MFDYLVPIRIPTESQFRHSIIWHVIVNTNLNVNGTEFQGMSGIEEGLMFHSDVLTILVLIASSIHLVVNM